MSEWSVGTSYVAQMLYAYWQQGTKMVHADQRDDWKVDFETVHKDAQEIAERVAAWAIEEHTQAKETPERREQRLARMNASEDRA